MIRWGGKAWRTLALTLVFLVGLTVPGSAQLRLRSGDHPKLDKVLNNRAGKPGQSKVIVIWKPGFDAASELRRIGGKPGKRLGLIQGLAGELSNGQLKQFANHPGVESIHHDRRTSGQLNRAAVVIGARAVEHQFKYNGAGIGVAVIDSGVTPWHDDLTYSGTSPLVRTLAASALLRLSTSSTGARRRTTTTVTARTSTGIIAGNGYDTLGARAGIAPAAHWSA